MYNEYGFAIVNVLFSYSKPERRPHVIDIGQRIRQLRIRNDLTLEELASRTELTKGFLSQLERNLTSPSLQTLSDIAEALGVSLSRFFAEGQEEQIVFTPEDAFTDEQEEYTIHWIIPNAQKNSMEPLLMEIAPHGRTQTVDPHKGEEFGYVLAGRVTLVNESNPQGLPVKKGETFYVKGNETHYLENRTEREAVLLWISTPPSF